MNIEELILEQLDEDGTLKTVRLARGDEITDLTVALPHSYDDDRVGPLHFLDLSAEKAFEQRLNRARARKLSEERLAREAGFLTYDGVWRGISTARQAMSLYVLTLPRFASIRSLSIRDPRKPENQYKRSLHKDEKIGKYSIYLDCRSRFGSFDFDLKVCLLCEKDAFSRETYSDQYTSVDAYASPPPIFDSDAEKIVQNFFNGDGDVYQVEQAGPVGKRAHTGTVTFGSG